MTGIRVAKLNFHGHLEIREADPTLIFCSSDLNLIVSLIQLDQAVAFPTQLEEEVTRRIDETTWDDPGEEGWD